MSTQPNSTIASQIEAAKELSNRKSEALRIFRPMPSQEAVLRCTARETLCRGGNRCQSASTVVWRKDGTPTTLGEVQVGDEIMAIVHGKSRRDRRAVKVIDKMEFRETAFRLTTKRGYHTDCTFDHPVWACPPLPPRYKNSIDPDYKNARWVEVKDLQPGWYVCMSFGNHVGWTGEVDQDAYIHGVMEGDGSIGKYGVMKLTGHKDESLCSWMSSHLESCGVRSRLYHRSENGVSLEWCNLKYKEEYLKWRPSWTASEMAGYIRGIADAEGCVTKDGKIVIVGVDLDLGRKLHLMLLQFGIKSSLYTVPACIKNNRPNVSYRLQVSGCSVRNWERSIGFSEAKKSRKLREISAGRRSPGDRRQWWDRVRSIDAVGVQDIVGITTESGTYISDGIVSHNSGKSMISAVRFASIATDIPVTLKSGEQVHCRLPHQRGRPLTMWCIGYGETHIGQTLYRLLFQRGAFKIIRDEKTKQWRAYDPQDPADVARASEVRDSPPLIPNRYVDLKGWVWKNKGARVFEKATIIDPTTKEVLANIYAFTSSGEVKAGDPVDEIWIDEKIEYPAYYPEWQARLIDKSGRLWWSSWPDISNNALLEIHKQAMRCLEEKSGRVREFVLRMRDNVHLPEESQKEAIQGWDPTERRARDDGEFVTDSLRMYPRFDTYVHGAIPEDKVEREDKVIELLRASGGQPPNDWTREIIVDPGTTHPAVLFVAITPPELGDYCIPYDEICGSNMDADQLAKLISLRCGGHHFYRFIMDCNAGRQTPMGFGRTVMQKYAESFAKHGLVSEMTGSNFIPGSNNVSGRIGELQDWMVVRTTGFPKLRIVTKFCPELCKQLTYYLKDNVNGVNEFKPAKRQQIDLATCLEYWAASSPRWVAPPRGGKPKSASERMKAMIDRMFKKQPEAKAITLGPIT